MLDELHVENLGIIRSAQVEPGPGLVAVTGETGAGKTLLLGALRLLKGDAARGDFVGPNGDETRVEGRFTLGSTETVAVRRVSSGRSRAYLDGSMVPARALADSIDPLVEIVAQHEHVALGRQASVRRLVDGCLDASGREAADGYRDLWARLVELRAARDSLGGDRQAMERELETARHQAAEIDGAGLEPDAEERNAARLARLRNAGEITGALSDAMAALDQDGGASDSLGLAISKVGDAAALDPLIVPLHERLRSAGVELSEAVHDLVALAGEIDHDADGLAAAEARTAVLADLKRKYGSSLPEVIAFGQRAAERAASIEELIARSETIDKEVASVEADAHAAAEALREARRRAAKTLASDAVGHLKQLGFSDPVLQIEVEPAALGPAGADRMELAFASDAALAPGPVSRVASGGELSRLVLAVRVAGGVADADIVAFDEIDAGVGGATALAMGELLASLSRGRQVLVVTHLPQVAAFADCHLVVDRSGNEAAVRRVEGEERLAELTRMLGGMEESAPGRDHAAELLKLASRRRS